MSKSVAVLSIGALTLIVGLGYVIYKQVIDFASPVTDTIETIGDAFVDGVTSTWEGLSTRIPAEDVAVDMVDGTNYINTVESWSFFDWLKSFLYVPPSSGEY
jgi:predicted PurR-regulated permease PerM